MSAEISTKKIWELAILKNSVFLSRPFWILFFKLFFLLQTSQHLFVSNDGSKILSSQNWQHFLTHAKHFEGECKSVQVCGIVHLLRRPWLNPLLIYLHLIFAIIQLEISNWMNLIFILFQTWILQATACRKIQFKLGNKSVYQTRYFKELPTKCGRMMSRSSNI